ncbi:MAG: hypothetical protein GYA16_02675 [Spirochaetes bacterium]|nr:hypothetical protein [Spirochaetota bacterium]HOM11202.1 type III-B CRISPR module-associated Cmr3 family protein [Spirochaetota bacterium]
MKWFSIEPLDTLFFRGAEPMVMGSDHSATLIFPPHTETISGALRTACIEATGVSFADYNEGKAPEDLLKKIGQSGSAAPFTVIGPLFTMNEMLFLPAPYTWFVEKHSMEKANISDIYPNVKVIIKNLYELSNDLVIVNGQSQIHWVKSGVQDLITAGGMWVSSEDFGKDKVSLYPIEHFFVKERRTGIALNEQKSVRSGHLYSFVHARLKKGVKIVCGIDKDIGLANSFHIRLGAEQRMCLVNSMPAPVIPSGRNDIFMALSLIEGNEQSNSVLIAGGKPIYAGGWDMHRRFHKPMKGYYPAGSVFSAKISENMIQI